MSMVGGNSMWRVGMACALVVLSSCGGGGHNDGSGSTTPLRITSTALAAGYVGATYSQALSAEGGTLPIRWSTTAVFPTGLTLSSSGELTGTVSNPVTADVSIQATDSSSPPQTVTKILTMSFAWGCDLSPSSLPAGQVNSAYSIGITSTDAVDPTTWTVNGSLPPGLELKNPTAAKVDLAGIPAQRGTYRFTIRAHALTSPAQDAGHEYTLTIASGLRITTYGILPGAVKNTAYETAFTAINGTPPYVWSSAEIPPDFSLNSATGVLSGTPTYSSAPFNFTVTVSDSASPPDSFGAKFMLAVHDQLSITGAVLKATWEENFNEGLQHCTGGGIYPYTWSIISGSLPPGVSMEAQSGRLYGIPKQAGDYTFTVQVQDSETTPQTAQAPFTLRVLFPALYLRFTTPLFLLGVPVDAYAVAVGGVPPYAFSGSLPPGLNLDPATGEITGTPTTTGSYPYVLQVTDSAPTPQRAELVGWLGVVMPIGRNDSISKATPLALEAAASISPYVDPPDATPAPDTDYYKIMANADSIVKIEIIAKRFSTPSVLDSVLEIVNANGVRLNACRQPGDTTDAFNSACLNDDIDATLTDSQLELKAPASDTTFYAHVLDWRGDARPDMLYKIYVTGAVWPLVATAMTAEPCVTGSACGAMLQATGGTTPLTWALVSGTVPPGMSFTADGHVIGTPTAAGDYSFVAQVTDSGTPPQTASGSYIIHVANPL